MNENLLIHRGIVNKQYKENLLKSFKQSFKQGYGIETDIHATKDHEFICFHDFTLNRIFKKKVSVKNIKYSQIKKISAQNKNPIPLLKDLIKNAGGSITTWKGKNPTIGGSIVASSNSELHKKILKMIKSVA